MATVRDITNRYLSAYTPVPPADDTICDICHRILAPGETTRCETCERTTSQVTHPVTIVMPISFSRDQYHYVLRDYKKPDHPYQARFRSVVAATLSRFYVGHAEHLRSKVGRWDTICVVPSASPGARDAEHALFDVVSRAPGVPDPTPLLVASATPPSHRAARDDGYDVTGGAQGRSILLIDDTYTTGATLQSAASALAISDAKVVAALVLGRYIDPAYAKHLRDWWEKLRRQSDFTFDVCCLE